jgi:hypothetical protein
MFSVGRDCDVLQWELLKLPTCFINILGGGEGEGEGEGERECEGGCCSLKIWGGCVILCGGIIIAK